MEASCCYLIMEASIWGAVGGPGEGRHASLLRHILSETCYCSENMENQCFSNEKRKSEESATPATRRFLEKENLC